MVSKAAGVNIVLTVEDLLGMVDIVDGSLEFTIKPFEIKTFKLYL